jgi:neutral ceramidase
MFTTKFTLLLGLWAAVLVLGSSNICVAEHGLRIGLAEEDITPPVGFPMAGYYHERLAEGTVDPLKAKAIVFRDQHTSAALVVCDLISIATDLSRSIRKIASEKTGIPVSNIVVSATHSHTAPDYARELYLSLGDENRNPLRATYIKKLIEAPANAIVDAHNAATSSSVSFGSVPQGTPVSFNRRSVMRDGSVRTWISHDNPDFVRSAGPIDPAIELLVVRNLEGRCRGVLSNFALHLDTVGGQKWSADYPFFIEQSLRKSLGSDVISIFGTGTCGDINHVNPKSRDRNKTDFIGSAIADSMTESIDKLKPLSPATLVAKSRIVPLPLEEATKEDVARSVQVLQSAQRKEKVDFFEHVRAYKKLMLDHLRHREPYANSVEYISWGLSRTLAGVGESIPVEVNVITLGPDVAIVSLPGEVFVELGLAIKQGSPFKTTFVIELSNAGETIYVPNRAAYAGGSYEVTNSALRPGSGEVLVEAALGLLREAAAQEVAASNTSK